jgi:hypothetical protein
VDALLLATILCVLPAALITAFVGLWRWIDRQERALRLKSARRHQD